MDFVKMLNKCIAKYGYQLDKTDDFIVNESVFKEHNVTRQPVNLRFKDWECKEIVIAKFELVYYVDKEILTIDNGRHFDNLLFFDDRTGEKIHNLALIYIKKNITELLGIEYHC